MSIHSENFTSTIKDSIINEKYKIPQIQSLTFKNKFLSQKKVEISEVRNAEECSPISLNQKISGLHTRSFSNPFHNPKTNFLKSLKINICTLQDKCNQATKLTKNIEEFDFSEDSFIIKAKQVESEILSKAEEMNQLKLNSSLGEDFCSYSEKEFLPSSKNNQSYIEESDYQESNSRENNCSKDTILKCLKAIEKGKVVSSVLGIRGSKLAIQGLDSKKKQRRFCYEVHMKEGKEKSQNLKSEFGMLNKYQKKVKRNKKKGKIHFKTNGLEMCDYVI